MKTDELVELLARSATRVEPGAAGRQFRWVLLLAAGASAVVSLGLLGIRPDWPETLLHPVFWGKLALSLATALLAGAVLWRLVHPGMRHTAPMVIAVLPAVLAWLAGLQQLAQAPAATRAALVLGTSWWQCLGAISLLSVPALVLALRAARGLAPTRLALTGTMAGLFAGGAAATAFSLYCIEMAPAYVGVWYVLGMLAPAAVGCALGPKALRW
jgi:hypothetical protein